MPNSDTQVQIENEPRWVQIMKQQPMNNLHKLPEEVKNKLKLAMSPNGLEMSDNVNAIK